MNFLANLLPDIEKRFQPKPAEKFDKRVCIVGDGLYGLAIASVLAQRCTALSIVKLPAFEVYDEPLFAYNDSQSMAEHRDSMARLKSIVVAPSSELAEAEYVIFTGGVSAYEKYVSIVKDYLRDGQNLIFLNSPIGAGLQFVHTLQKEKLERKFNVVELGNIFYGVRTDGDTLVIRSLRTRANIAGNTRNQLRKNMQFDALLPTELIPSSNLIERGLLETERLLRPTLILFGLLGLRTSDHNLGLSASILNPTTLALLEKLESELGALAKAYKATPPIFGNIAETTTYSPSLAKNSNVRGHGPSLSDGVTACYLDLTRSISKASNPSERAKQILVRDLTEHVVILSELARLARINRQTLDSLIDLASGITDMDIRRNARNLSHLGLTGFDLPEIVELVNA